MFDRPVAAVLEPRGRGLAAIRLFEHATPIQLKQGAKRSEADKLKPGELVIVEPAGMARGKKKGGAPVVRDVGKIVRRIGRPDNARDVLEALFVERGYVRGFPGRVINAAREAVERPDPFSRDDLTELPTFTMDPDGAKDYDDAISARRDADGIRVWVHIADVSA
ncbi:MAG: RNB domain-containing ribonuclease, partial [Thermoleophilaceae bacterium]|nr:RNB domain-containing ribonuclease [Thermoleophilaceae bacterium]